MRTPIQVPVHEGRLFTWRGNEGSVEASCLGTRPMSRVWSDAADEGFEVLSHKTGKVVLFVLENTAAYFGEVKHWVFRGYDKNSHLTITVFND